MKKNYVIPAMQVVRINIRHHLLNGSDVTKAAGNVFNQNQITGSSGEGRSRAYSDFDWDDWE